MNNRLLILSLLVAVPFISGCSWLVPGKVKSEAVMMRTNIETAIEETQALPDDASKQKSLRALYRMYPHVVNWDDYVHGRKSTSKYDARYMLPAEVVVPAVPSVSPEKGTTVTPISDPFKENPK